MSVKIWRIFKKPQRWSNSCVSYKRRLRVCMLKRPSVSNYKWTINIFISKFLITNLPYKKRNMNLKHSKTSKNRNSKLVAKAFPNSLYKETLYLLQKSRDTDYSRLHNIGVGKNLSKRILEKAPDCCPTSAHRHSVTTHYFRGAHQESSLHSVSIYVRNYNSYNFNL